jgi:fatty acid desaturase
VQHLSDRPRAALQRYAVRADLVRGARAEVDGQNSSSAGTKTYSFEPESFYMTLRRRVQQHVEEQHIKSVRRAGPVEAGKWISSVTLFMWTWWRVVFHDFSAGMCLLNALARCVLIGQAHEALHTILFPQWPDMQRLFSEIGLQFIGVPYEDWHMEHVLLHHPHTNTDIDPDLNMQQNIPVWRLTAQTPWNVAHTWPLVTSNVIGLLMPSLNVLLRSFKLLFPFAVLRRGIVFCWACLLLLHWLPMFYRPWKSGLKAVFLTSMLCSLITLHAFHANHVAQVAQESPYELGVDWGVHQVRTTANFDAWFLSGGLDLQIEHHLFPMLSYNLQREVKPIVMETCREFGVPYYSASSLLSHMYTMFAHMVWLGWSDASAVQADIVFVPTGNASRLEV